MVDFAAEPDAQDPHVLRVSGELDLASVETFLDRARAALPGTGSALELDLGGLDFIDSTGLGALVRIRREARQAGSDITLSHVPAKICRVLDMTGLSDLLGDPPSGG